VTELAAGADALRALHHGTEPLLLANVWDAAGARIVEAAGFPAVASSSGAVAKAHGYEDDDCMPVDVAFGAVAEIAGAVSVPVTADIEAGYGLGPAELVERLLAAGAVGCNVEDTDHRGESPLVEAEVQADRIAAVKEAGRRAGVDMVVNARVDVFVRQVGAPETQVDEMVRRGRMYLDAGADCVYPIGVVDTEAIRHLVDGIPGPVNAMLRRGAPSIAALRDLGVARISLGSGLFGLTARALVAAVERLLAGDAEVVWHR
jgi:2-methylisocitrate lyase-like PEP mutase family enzyme